MQKQKLKFKLKIIVICLLQAFFVVNLAWAGDSVKGDGHKSQREMLAPRLHLANDTFKLFIAGQTDIQEDISSADSIIGLASANHIYESMEQGLKVLPIAVEIKLQALGLDTAEINQAKEVLVQVAKLYNQMGLSVEHYHNHVHNLITVFGMLRKIEILNLDSKDYKKVAFLAALFHDFHLREKIEKRKGTPAYVEETIRQIADLIGGGDI